MLRPVSVSLIELGNSRTLNCQLFANDTTALATVGVPRICGSVAAQTMRRKLEWSIPDAVYARPNIIALQISMHFNKIVVECIIISATATYAIVAD